MVTVMLEEITEFIKESKVATVCCVKDGLPHCFNCLYAYIPGIQGMVFKSSGASLHTAMMQDEIPVAGTIYQSSKSGLDNTGIQFYGKAAISDEVMDAAEKAYYKRYPLALIVRGQLCAIVFDSIKFTKTTKGIRRKCTWEKEELNKE